MESDIGVRASVIRLEPGSGKNQCSSGAGEALTRKAKLATGKTSCIKDSECLKLLFIIHLGISPNPI